MPKLAILRLGNKPCWTPAGITLKGLVALARRFPELSELCVHIQAQELAGTVANPSLSCEYDRAPAIPNVNCALSKLQVGGTPIDKLEILPVALTLVQVVLRIINIEYANPRWGGVSETIKLFKSIGGRIHASGMHLSHS